MNDKGDRSNNLQLISYFDTYFTGTSLHDRNELPRLTLCSGDLDPPAGYNGGVGASSSYEELPAYLLSTAENGAGPPSNGFVVSSAQPAWMPSPFHGGADSSNSNIAVSSSQYFAECPPAQPSPGPTVKIIEQPTPLVRFRYKKENRGGPIPGICSTPEHPTYPTISIHNYVGPALIIVSCVTADRPYKVHPHYLWLVNNSNNASIDGIVAIKKMIKRNNNVVEVKKIKIQCVKWPEVQVGMQRRKHVRVPELHTLEIDPFGQGFDYCLNPKNVDLNKVRLAFQVFVRQNEKEPWKPLDPVVSEVVFKASGAPGQGQRGCPSRVPDIKCASHDSGTTTGGTKMIILLTEMIDIRDMNVVFYEKDLAKETVWTAIATTELVFTDNIAIVVRTPPYSGPSHDDRISVCFYLYKRSVDQCSRSLPFDYIFEFQVSELSPKNQSKTKKVRVRRAAPTLEKVGTATTTKEKTKAGETDKALNGSLAQLSIKS